MDENKSSLHAASERVEIAAQRFREAKLNLNENTVDSQQAWRDAADAYGASLEEYAAALHVLHFELIHQGRLPL